MSSPKYWREIPQRYRLEACRCENCGNIHYPPRIICAQCGARRFKTISLRNEGTVETFTVIYVPPSRFIDQAPYAIGIVKLSDDIKMLVQVVDCEPEELRIGMPVKLEFRKIYEEGEAGILCYGHKAVPA